MKFYLITIVISVFWVATTDLVNPDGVIIKERFKTPQGYERMANSERSYAHFLQTLPLKPFGSKVKYFDGKEKNTPNVYVSVIDLSIGQKDLHQCADAVMRLRAEYFFKQKQYDNIHFNFLADGKPRYFNTFAKGHHNYPTFWKYMEYVFASANTRSLHDELMPVPISDMQIGDVLIQKGVPFGHAVVVVDMAVEKRSGKKCYLLAQSYMPAQEIQILINTNNKTLSPWYELNSLDIETPEWDFKPLDLRRFKQ